MTPLAAHLSTASNQRIEVIGLALIVCAAIFELLRRRRLLERYALVWFAAGVCVLVLAVWKGLLTTLSHAVGIYYPPSALFAVAFLFVLVLLVNFSTTVSRLSDQSNVLAQRLALLQRKLEEQDVGADGGNVPAENSPGPLGRPRANAPDWPAGSSERTGSAHPKS
jgi:hypothetical protein